MKIGSRLDAVQVGPAGMHSHYCQWMAQSRSPGLATLQ